MALIDYETLILSHSPALYWPLDSVNGATDLSGNGYNGSAQGGVTIGGDASSPGPGFTTGSTDFDGSNDYVDTSAYNAMANGTTRTFEAWAYRDQNLGYHAIWTPTHLSNTTLMIYYGGNDVYFTVNANSVVWTNAWPGVTQWVHVALVFNEATDTAELFLNGASQGTKTQTSAWPAYNTLLFGNSGYAGAFDGKLAHAAVYESGLSASEIQDHYLAGIGELEEPRPPVVIGRSYPPDELALYVDRPAGLPVRIAGDEPSFPLADYTLASQLNGGYSEADASVLKVLGDSGVHKHAGVRVLLPDGRTVWRGRVESTPESSDTSELKLSMIGHQALLEDVKNVTLLGVDSDMSGWEEPPRGRRRTLADAGQSVNGAFSVSVDDDGMSITMTPDRNVKTTSMGELWYLGNDEKRVAEIQYIASEVSSTGMLASFRAFSTVTGSPYDTHTVINTLTLTSWTPNSPAHYLALRDTPTGGDANKPGRLLEVHAASLYGNHGLPRHNISGLPDGLKFSDIIAYLIERFQPLLPVTQVDPSSFVMPHAVWLDPVSLGDVLSEGMATEFNRNWAVWEGFEYRRRQDMGRTWDLRRSEGARFINSGEAAEPDVNTCLVVYTAKDGSTKWAGPPGSGADVSDVALRDYDPGNPVNASAVVGDRALVIEADGLDSTDAVAAGVEALEQALRPRFVGEIQVPRFALRDGVLEPTSLMRADDWVVDSEGGGKRMPLSEVNYARSSERPCTATVDLPPNRLDSELARQGLRPQRVRRAEIRKRYRKMRRRRQRQRERQEEKKKK